MNRIVYGARIALAIPVHLDIVLVKVLMDKAPYRAEIGETVRHKVNVEVIAPRKEEEVANKAIEQSVEFVCCHSEHVLSGFRVWFASIYSIPFFTLFINYNLVTNYYNPITRYTILFKLI